MTLPGYVTAARPTDFNPGQLDAAPPTVESQKARQPNPFPEELIILGEGPDAPKMRLYRDRFRGEMAIQFDERPDPEHTAVLKDAGFGWDSRDRVWKLPLDEGSEWKGKLHAEKVFRDVGSAIREQAGLGPVVREQAGLGPVVGVPG